MHRYDAPRWYGTFSVTPEYGQAFKTRRIAEYFFGFDTIKLSGSLIQNRADNDVLADNFGLSPQFESIVTMIPRVRTTQVHFNWWTGFRDFYFTMHAPLVSTTYGITLNEAIIQTGQETPFPAGYMAADAIPAPFTSFTNAIKGVRPFGNVTTGLLFGRIDCPRTITKFSDIQVALGWNFVNREETCWGINVRASAPTGNRSTAEFLFEPMVGNGKHWEVGAGLCGKILIFEVDGYEQVAHILLNANITTLLASCQQRSFDFCQNGFGSRYMLLKEFSNGLHNGILHPAINKTTLPCRVSADAQFDLMALFGYQCKGLGIDLGYNLWMRTHEKITLTGRIPERTYGIKGIQNTIDPMTTVPDSNTQSTGNLHGNNLSPMEQMLTADRSPLFISNCDLDLESGASPFALTHKLFLHVNYTWNNRPTYHLEPYLGAGIATEFEGSHPRELQPDKNTMSQWSVWIKAGFAY